MIRFRLIPLLLIWSLAWAGGPGEVVLAMESHGDHLDPHRPGGNNAHALMAIYDSLTRQDAEGVLHPHLATSWEQRDELTWRFTLRDDVTFHNGEAFNADTVRLNLDRMLNPSQVRASYSFSVVEGYRLVDDYTIDITTVAPDPMLPARMQNLLIGPQSMLGEPGPEGFNRNAIGSGPFKFVEWIPGERIVLEANPDYWMGPPSIQRLVIREIPEKSSQVSELLAGGVDVVPGIPPEFISLVQQSRSADIVTTQSPVIQFYAFRTDVESPLQDKRVRQAINFAVDVETIITELLSGQAHRVATVFPAFALGFNPDVEPYPYDPERARELLASAGFADGFVLDFDVSATGSTGGINSLEVAQAVAQYLGQVGIEVRLRTLEYGEMVNRIHNGTTAPMFEFGWKIWDRDPDGLLYGVLNTESFYTAFPDEYLDEQILAARFNLNESERERIYSDLQPYILDEAPFLFLYHTNAIYGVSTRVEWQPRLDERYYFYDAKLR